MRFICQILAFLCLCLGVAVPYARALTPQQEQSVRFSEAFIWFDHVNPPQAIENLKLVDGAGPMQSIQDFKGRYLLLNLWATWCPPCIEELPSLSRLRTLRGGRKFDVIAISVDKNYTGPRIARFLERKKISGLGAYYDVAGDFQRTLAPRGLPTTYLIDPQGKVRFKMAGPAKWNSKDALAFIDSVIEQLEKSDKAKK